MVLKVKGIYLVVTVPSIKQSWPTPLSNIQPQTITEAGNLAVRLRQSVKCFIFDSQYSFTAISYKDFEFELIAPNVSAHLLKFFVSLFISKSANVFLPYLSFFVN